MSKAGKLKDLRGVLCGSPRHCNTSGKVVFDKKGAQSAKNFHWNRDHVELRIYPCPYCNGWHLTSQVR